jgi:acyl-CoA synthetase (NDP forming)
MTANGDINVEIADIIKAVRKEGRVVLTEHESKEILAKKDIPVTKEVIGRDKQEVMNAAKEIGYPVALKISSAEITHKYDFGGVCLGIKNEEELISAYESIAQKIKGDVKTKPESAFLVQEMVEKGMEMLVGSKKDPSFGPTILFGLGGIFTEVLNDTSLRICPIERRDAVEMIQEIKSYKILKGYRGIPPADMESLISVLMKVSDLVIEHEEIEELDINPLFVSEEGVIAADALIVLEKGEM